MNTTRRGFLGGLLALAAVPLAKAMTKPQAMNVRTVPPDYVPPKPLELGVIVNGGEDFGIVHGDSVLDCASEAQRQWPRARMLHVCDLDNRQYVYGLSRTTYPKLKRVRR